MTVWPRRPSTYCFYRGIVSKLAKHYSTNPSIVRTKAYSKIRKKKLFQEICNHKELVQLLNARLGRLQGSSDEFHVLRPAHHDGCFEDRWQEMRDHYDSSNIIERSAEILPPSDISPAFLKRLQATQGKAAENEADNWVKDMKSFHKQMIAKAEKMSIPTMTAVPATSEITQLVTAKTQTRKQLLNKPKTGDVAKPALLDKTVLLSAAEELDKEEINYDDYSENMIGMNMESFPDGSEQLHPSSYDESLSPVQSLTSVQSLPDTITTNSSRLKINKYTLSSKKSRELEKWKQNPNRMNILFNNDLEAYINACIFAGLVDKAFSTIKFYNYLQRQKPMELMAKITKPEIYSALMHALAKQGRLSSIRDLFKQMEVNLKPSLQCYTACLECLARKDPMDLQLGEYIIQDLRRAGLDERDIFNSCTFRHEERQYVWKALKTLNTDYEPNAIETSSDYSGDLLQQLNYPLPSHQMVERNPYSGVVDCAHLEKQIERQRQWEYQDHVVVKSIIQQKGEKSRSSAELDKTLEAWKRSLEKGFIKKLSYYEHKRKHDNRMTLYPYLKLFPPKEYVSIIMRESTRLATDSETFSPGLGFLWQRMGSRVFYKFLIQDKVNSLVAKKVIRLYRDFIEKYNEEDAETINHRIVWQDLMEKHSNGPSLDVPYKTWPMHVIKGVGRILFDIVLYGLKIDIVRGSGKNASQQSIPAFYTIYRNYSYITKEEVKPHPQTMKLFQANGSSELVFDTIALPMLIPPVPWVSENIGSNLLATTKLVRLPESMHGSNKISQMSPISSKDLVAVFDGLNILSACSWIINKPMLDIICDVFNNKGDKDLDIPPPCTECPPLPKITSNMNAQQRSRAQRMRVKLKQQRAEMYSLWCNELYKLSIANHFRDEVFWFPHNMDFRGRTYPCPPHFNHLGSDVTRSILLFAKGQKLGKNGLDWLKIHLINLTGFKKRSSNAERLQYSNEILNDILDSADRPMKGSKWWQTSDTPWQTLSCCVEIANAIRSEDPANYVSHFPVHQDGSCNGLQHYAALGRDQSGAESVNLYPSDRPKDVYSDVCEMVESERIKDANNGVLVAQKLEGFVLRKVIKQTIMTTVYGVTKYGAKYQILKQLKDMPSFDQEFLWAACVYLTEKTFFCLTEMFTATRDIQMWLTFCAYHISTICQRPVNWVTPLGLPVVQPYHRLASMQRWGVTLTNASSTLEKPNSIKQKNAFPPNFVHSLDSTHMFLTALFCIRSGITYVSVHDCFWTHPSSVEIMNQICREQFVALHSQPILEDLSKHMVRQFCTDPSTQQQLPEDQLLSLDTVLGNIPQKGEFDLKKILQSTYFFS